MDIKVIVNPTAGSRSVEKEWSHIKDQLQKCGLHFDSEITEYVRHAEEIAKNAADTGYRYLIAIGGDGTISEVANGILKSSAPEKPILGVTSRGTAHNFADSLGVQKNNIENLANYPSGKCSTVDVGFLECNNEGQVIQRYFVNHASVGFPAEIVDEWRYLPKLFGRNTNLMLRKIAGYKAFITYRSRHISVEHHEDVESTYYAGIIVSNGQYVADGVPIAPHASLQDGLLDVIIFYDLTKAELFKLRSSLYDGTHLSKPKVRETKIDVIKIEPKDKLLVEADGDIIGESPIKFQIIPSALKVVW